MAKLVFDEVSKRFYETGVKKCVLFPQDVTGAYENGVAWNGITGINERPGGAEANPMWADDIKYATIRSAETFGGTIEAYTYPEEFRACDGSVEVVEGVVIGQQKRSAFGLAYVTTLGNDTEGIDHGYKLHLVYNATASPSERSYQTINESPEALTMSWEIETTPVPVTGYKPTATLTIDSTKVTAEKLAELENKLYGTADTEPQLPSPDEVIALFSKVVA